MLGSLTIKNVVLIEALALDFREGLCALTGETGAGKSILLDALGLALGARSDAGLVRRGTDQASVDAAFEVSPRHPVYALLREAGIEIDPGEPVLLRRALNADGRSRAFINDRPVSAALLKDAGALLVEIHGQFDTQGLLNPATHRDLLDSYAGVDKTLENVWKTWAEARDAVAKARADTEAARAEEEYLRGAVADLDELSPQEGEEDRLSALRSRLMRREQILAALQAGHEGAAEAETLLNGAYRALEKAGEESAGALAALDRAGAELQEAMAQILRLSADLEESEHDLTGIDDRLHALKGAARKFSCAPDDLPAKREELAGRLTLIERGGDVLSGLMKAQDAARKAYAAAARDVSEKRKGAAAKLDALVAKELPPLKLDKARFVTLVEPLPEAEWGPGGADRVRFLVATNPGAEPGPLNKIASGGEMARFMLALKVVMAETGAAQTLIFDEADSGIGGATADAVGERLARLAKKRQVLTVTHSPQVAARAAHHWIVAKQGKDDMRTHVLPLEEPALRREEIARMLAGAHVTDEARAAAGKLLEHAA